MITIRPLRTKAELEQYMELCIYCFSFSSEYTPYYANFIGPHLDCTMGAFDGPRLVAAMWGIPFEMNVIGAHLPMAGISVVATRPEVRNLGLAKKLMTASHQRMKKEGIPLAVLMPFKPVFYARMGYGDVFYYHDCQLQPGAIAELEPRGYRIAPVDGNKEWKTFDRLHRQYSARYFGTVNRGERYWKIRYMNSPFGPRFHYLIMCGREVAGYIITHLDKPSIAVSSDLRRETRLTIMQAVWTDQGSFDAILQFVRAHRDQHGKIEWYLPTDVPLHDRLVDQRITVALKPKMMLKLVDLKAAIERRPFTADLDADIILQVKGDDTSPWNDGLWRIRWRGGEAKVTRTAAGAGRARIDIASLAVLYSGHRDAAALERLGHLSGPRAAIETLARAFPARVCYIDDWF